MAKSVNNKSKGPFKMGQSSSQISEQPTNHQISDDGGSQVEDEVSTKASKRSKKRKSREAGDVAEDVQTQWDGVGVSSSTKRAKKKRKKRKRADVDESPKLFAVQYDSDVASKDQEEVRRFGDEPEQPAEVFTVQYENDDLFEVPEKPLEQEKLENPADIDEEGEEHAPVFFVRYDSDDIQEEEEAPVQSEGELEEPARLFQVQYESDDVTEAPEKLLDAEEPLDEETESARVLLQLRNEVHYNSTQSAKGDDIAVSAQLLRESSPAQVHKNFEDSNTRGRKAKKAKRPKKRAEKMRAQQPAIDEEEEAPPSDFEPTLPNQHAMSNASRHLFHPYVESKSLPQSTLSLDDVDSNDETLAPYLRSYEQANLGPNFDNQTQDEDQDLTTSYTQLAADAFSQATVQALRKKEARRPATSRQSKKGKKLGRIKNSMLPEKIFLSDEEISPHGQSNLWLDNDVNVSDVNDQEMPIDPNLMSTGFSTMQIENYQHSIPVATKDPTKVQAGTLNRPSMALKKRGRDSEASNLDDPVNHGQDASHQHDSSHEKNTQSIDSNLDPDLTATPSSKRRKRHIPTKGLGSTKSTEKVPRKRRRVSGLSPINQVPNSGGPFTSTESDILHTFRDSYCAEHEISPQKFNEIIHTNSRNVPKMSAFWTELCNLIPYRGRQSIQKFCRRQFHNFEKRGAWSAEDDVLLKQAFAVHGKSWKAVGEIVGRLSEDVRDRWRNYHHNSENRAQEAWTEEEIMALVKAVGECIWLLQAELRREREEFIRADGHRLNVPDENQDPEKLVNWQIVSDRMGGVRSRLQCSYKWKTLERAGRVDLGVAFRRIQKAVDKGKANMFEIPVLPGNNWRDAKAQIKAQLMLTGDKYDLLEAMLDCRASEEQTIKWSTVGYHHAWRSRWTGKDLKAQWQMLKEDAGEVEDLGSKYHEVVKRLLTKLATEEGDKLEERWPGNGNGDVGGEKNGNGSLFVDEEADGDGDEDADADGDEESDSDRDLAATLRTELDEMGEHTSRQNS